MFACKLLYIFGGAVACAGLYKFCSNNTHRNRLKRQFNEETEKPQIKYEPKFLGKKEMTDDIIGSFFDIKGGLKILWTPPHMGKTSAIAQVIHEINYGHVKPLLTSDWSHNNVNVDKNYVKQSFRFQNIKIIYTDMLDPNWFYQQIFDKDKFNMLREVIPGDTKLITVIDNFHNNFAKENDFNDFIVSLISNYCPVVISTSDAQLVKKILEIGKNRNVGLTGNPSNYRFDRFEGKIYSQIKEHYGWMGCGGLVQLFPYDRTFHDDEPPKSILTYEDVKKQYQKEIDEDNQNWEDGLAILNGDNQSQSVLSANL